MIRNTHHGCTSGFTNLLKNGISRHDDIGGIANDGGTTIDLGTPGAGLHKA